VIVEATDHKLVLNEGSILWLTEQRIPLGIVDEVFGPVKKPYYVVRYNEAADIPEGATQGRDVAFVPELANFVQDDPELRKKGYDASGEHDEELSEADEFSDDEKEEEMRRAKRSNRVQGMGNSGRRGGRGGQEGGGGDRSTGRRGRGRGGHGRGRDFKTESPEMVTIRLSIEICGKKFIVVVLRFLLFLLKQYTVAHDRCEGNWPLKIYL
jgi:H/ACA ribonucleoprotein complex non-core subunit NAF1